MKRLKLYFSMFCMLMVIGVGVSFTILPTEAKAIPPYCRCKWGGDYYLEKINGVCQYLCD